MFCAKCGFENTQEANYCARCGVPLHSSAPAVPEQPISEHAIAAPNQAAAPIQSLMSGAYAGFWMRVAASIIDGIIISVVTIPLSLFISFLAIGSSASDPDNAGFIMMAYGLIWIISIVAKWLYFAIMESSAKQGTIGKWALGIRVCDLHGQRISFGRASARHFAKIISGLTLCIGYLMVAFTGKKQGLHDLVASCLVVNKHAQTADLQHDLPRKTPVAVIVLAVGALLIVPIAIIGILAAIAIPAYQEYTVRAKYAEIDTYAQVATQAVENYYYTNGNQLPATLAEAGVETHAKYISAARIADNGIISLDVNLGAQGGELLYVPTLDENDRVIWRCESDNIKPTLLPRRCREPQPPATKEVL